LPVENLWKFPVSTDRRPACSTRTIHERYRCIRSAKRRKLLVIHYDTGAGGEGYYMMPAQIRSHGPWTDGREGEVVNLKPGYRLQLARQNDVLIEDPPYGWTPEAS
jgi:hypothetical protein